MLEHKLVKQTNSVRPKASSLKSLLKLIISSHGIQEGGKREKKTQIINIPSGREVTATEHRDIKRRKAN